LATVVIGGIISSTLLTLFVLPVLYSLFHRERPLAVSALPAAASNPSTDSESTDSESTDTEGTEHVD
ncbi:MAG: hypothetical protein CVV27_09385, partial [Candidatus Melainabacteria bacterium HGW-Melainabacteria-1]